jgi:hypothetical protein
MTISEYKLKRDFRAPQVNVKANEFQGYFYFQKGQSAIGYVDDSTGIKLLITENMYAVPVSSLDFVRDIEIDGEAVDYTEDGVSSTDSPEKIKEIATKNAKEQLKSEKVTIPQEYRDQMDKIKNTSMVNTIVNKSRNSVNGLLIGGVIGLIGAIATRQSKFMGIVLFGTLGGAIGYGMTGDAKKPAPKKEAPKEPIKTEEQAKSA